MNPKLLTTKPCLLIALVGTVLLLGPFAGRSAGGDCCKPVQETSSNATKSLESKWGIQVDSLRLSAGGFMIDFRYKVLDPVKAATLADRQAKPYLLDQATGAKLSVPRSPKVGPLRQAAENLTAGKVYFALFSNPGKLVKQGNKVTVVVGGFRAENLVVQ